MWMVILGTPVVALAAVIWTVSKKSADAQARKDAALDAFYADMKDEKVRWLERALAAARALKTAPKDSSPLLHRPVYDCASDEFEVPCSYTVFDGMSLNDRGVGWMRSFGEVEKLLKDFSAWIHGDPRTPEGVAFIDGGDHFTVVSSGGDPNEPGGVAYRVVKTGESEWFLWKWRTGMRRVPEDPPFLIHELAKDASRWARREASAPTAQKANSGYEEAARKCKHAAVSA